MTTTAVLVPTTLGDGVHPVPGFSSNLLGTTPKMARVILPTTNGDFTNPVPGFSAANPYSGILIVRVLRTGPFDTVVAPYIFVPGAGAPAPAPSGIPDGYPIG